MNKLTLIAEPALFDGPENFLLIDIDAPEWAHDMLSQLCGCVSTYQVALTPEHTFVGYDMRSQQGIDEAASFIRKEEARRFRDLALTPSHPNPDVGVHA